jgi:hypothetical protein
MKQETIEEAAWELAKQKFEEKCDYKPNLSNSQHLLVVSSIQEGILIGAKWQAEKMYSEEDLISFAHFYFKEEFNSTMQTSKSTDEILQEWFTQFKKK